MCNFLCYVCSASCVSISQLQSHLHRHNSDGELPCPIKCCQDNCKSTFTTVFNFIRHLKAYHKTAPFATGTHYTVSDIASASSSQSGLDDICQTNVADIHAVHAKSAVDCLTDIQTEAASLAASLRANSSIPYSVIPVIMDSFNNILDRTVSSVQSEMLNTLRTSDISADSLKEVELKMNRQAETLHDPLKVLSTRYRQDKFFESHPLAVKPETVVVGQRFETRENHVLVYDTFEYVSVESTLRSLLQNKNYVELLLADHCTPGMLVDFQDGLRYKNHSLFSDKSKFSIVLQLFYDGMGTTNPLRGQSSMYNVGVFYYVVKNLPNVYNSCFANVHLLCLAYSADIKVYGFDSILGKFVDEMKHLSMYGFNGNFPIIGNRQIYVGLGQVSCDNLALNSIFGFIESFSGDHFCTMCFATRDDIQTKFYEEDFERRTAAEYDKDVGNLSNMDCQSKCHSRGVKHPCVLNTIPDFHVTDNYCLDIMHIVLEGIIPVELGCILYYLCNLQRYFSLADLRVKMENFWSVINVDKHNKPPELNTIEKPGHRISPSMKAVQSWALMKYLPLILGDVVPADNDHWLFLLHLSEMVDIIFARRFTLGMVSYLRELIAEHLTMFKQLYCMGNDAVALRPKHHLLVHLPSVILHSGPLIGMNCLCYELKNSFFKRCAHIMCNFTNVCKTLAYRQQQYTLYAKMSNAHVRDFFVVGRNACVAIFSLTYASALCEKFSLQMTDDIVVTNSLERASVVYKEGFHVVVDVDDTGLPVFGMIEQFVCLPDSSEWFMVLQSLRTDCFVSHYHSYMVDYPQPPLYRIVSFDDLIDYHAVCLFSKTVAGRQQHFIRLQYHIFK